MRKLFLIFVIAMNIFTFTACEDNSNESNGNHAELNYQILRTNEHGTDNLPIATVIYSRHELEQYYENACPNHFYPNDNLDQHAVLFLEAIEKYTDEFFISNYLVIVLLEEGSSSIGHEVESIDKDGSIAITRLLPGEDMLMAADMAEWHIIIELGNGFIPEQFYITLTDKAIS